MARTRPWRRGAGGVRSGGSSVVKPMLWFALAGLAVVLVLGLAATGILRRNARHEAVRDAQEITRLAGNGIAEPAITTALLSGDPRSRARFDRVMRSRVRRDPVLRVKLWTLDGRIVYSDEPRLVGRRFGLDREELAAARNHRVEAEVSDLDRPENRYERRFGKLLEVYLPVRGPGGTPLLFEDYLRFSSVSAGQSRVFSRFAPALLGALFLLWIAQLPLGWSLARRLRQRQQEREALLSRALDSSDLERRRIAQHLHDGVVQDLAGVSYSLSAAGERLERGERSSVDDTVRTAATATRRAISELRALLIGIYPPSLRRAGLAAALSDLASPLSAKGLAVDVHLDEQLDLPADVEEVLFRGAQEALRNVAKHADAGRVEVSVGRENGSAVLCVADDGAGFDHPPGVEAGGHLGLRLLEDLARERHGRLELASAPGEGTRLRLTVPAP